MKLKTILLTLFVTLSPHSLYAQSPLVTTVADSVDRMPDPIGNLPESMEQSLDSLMTSKYKTYYSYGKVKRAPLNISETNANLYRAGLKSMVSAIPLSYNNAVGECIDLYLNSRSNLVGRMLSRSTYYFPIIEDILDRNGLPIELKYLAIIESALNPTAVSRMGATGLWQFMLSTGKLYGLKINSLIDERCDPVKSTEAACRYFKEMYGIYHDWLLVIASYNCGPGNVNKAIRRAGGATDFWTIYPYLPKETRSYVPFFIAAFYSMEHYSQYGIHPNLIEMPLMTDTIMVPYLNSFRDLSHMTKVSVDTLRLLNPQYRRGIVPGNSTPQIVVLPSANVYDFVEHRDSLYNLLRNRPVEIRTTTLTHRVKSRESLLSIAKSYNVSIEDIKSWNRLRSSRVHRGQRLKIHLTTEVAQDPFDDLGSTNGVLSPSVSSGGRSGSTSSGIPCPYGRVIGPSTSSDDEVEQPKPKEQHPKTKVVKKKAQRSHIVKKGEGLYSISKKYGVPVSKIKKANGLKGSMIHVGQRLIIP